MKVVVPTKLIEIPDTESRDLYEPNQRKNGSQYRFSVVGAGTANIQPIFDGQATHKPETVQNDTVILDYSGVENMKITASGGNISVTTTVLGQG